MIKDTRWPALPMAALRAAQGFFSLILLACSSYVVSKAAIW